MKQVDYLFWLKDKEDNLMAEREAQKQDLDDILADDKEWRDMTMNAIEDIEEELLIVRGIKKIVQNYLDVDDE